jgi:hypothetical protein
LRDEQQNDRRCGIVQMPFEEAARLAGPIYWELLVLSWRLLTAKIVSLEGIACVTRRVVWLRMQK